MPGHLAVHTGFGGSLLHSNSWLAQMEVSKREGRSMVGQHPRGLSSGRAVILWNRVVSIAT